MNACASSCCPTCGDPLVLLDGDVTRRCRWCGYVDVGAASAGESRPEAADVDDALRPAQEGGRHAR